MTIHRRSFLSLLGIAPVALAVAPPVVASAAKQFRVGIIGDQLADKFPQLTMEEMEERYFRPYCEQVHKEMLESVAINSRLYFHKDAYVFSWPPETDQQVIG